MAKKSTGCTIVIVGVVIVFLVVLIGRFISSSDEDTPATTQPSATTEATATSPPEVEIDLVAAQEQGLVSVSAAGRSAINFLSLSLASHSDDPLKITILPGTMFVAQTAGVQDMMVITKKTLSLSPHGSFEDVTVDTACANMTLDVPERADSLVLSTGAIPEDLAKLLALDDFQIATDLVQQFAVWTITDNPARDGYVGIVSNGSGSGPTDEQIEQIKELFSLAAIPLDRYQALN